jgi:molecular chaperone HscA
MAIIPINLKEGTISLPNISESNDDLIVGIDLGTTNSLVAYVKDGTAITVLDETGKHALVPSVIHFDENSDIVVGDKAKEKLLLFPERTIYSAKRLMGKSYKDLENLKENFGYKIIENEGESLVKVKVDDRFYNPIELSSFILKELKDRIESRLNKTVSKAVITVPAYFNDAQRQATRDAGKLAGLDVLRIINEPTAASLAYGIGLNKEDSKTVAVYDLGGGTFDISILEIQDGIFDVLSTNGDTLLGGDDFDKIIMDFWIQQLGIEKLNENKSLLQSLRLAAEKAKKHIGKNENFTEELSYDGKKISLEISKSKFEDLARPIIEKTIRCCEFAMKDSGKNISEIDEIIMVGGSTRIPLVQNMVQDFFQKPLHNELNPDEVVALGAAIQADVLAGNQKDVLLLDITPLSLGIETVGGLMDTILPRNSKIPIRAGRQYTTSVDGQKNLKIAIYQGERDLVEHNRKLGEFILKNIPPMPAGLPKIEVTFTINADGILSIKAEELRSSTAQTVEIKSTYGISEEEMALMLLDSIQNAKTDMEQRSLLEAINEANNVILSSEKFIIQNKDILSEEEVEEIKNKTILIKNAIEKRSKDEIQKSMEEMNMYSEPLAHRALDYNIGNAMKGKAIG